jgi:8-oxo-dGTP pyrophosphatase MutT (NUDIX family)
MSSIESSQSGLQKKDKHISYGIIAYKMIGGIPNYCLIRRKDTYSYVDFIRGKYSLNNIRTLQTILKFLTRTEKENILAHMNDFTKLWNELWIIDKDKVYSKSFYKEYDQSKNKFEMLTKGVLIFGQLVTLEKLLRSCSSVYLEPEWGFPKGRKNRDENELLCALREFYEETGVSSEHIRVRTDIPRIEETYIADDGIQYTHYYYVGECNPAINVQLNPLNKHQISEISAIEWFSYERAISKIRDYNIEKKRVLTIVHSYTRL